MEQFFIKRPDGARSLSGKDVHIKQGDLDGACGIYSLYMSLAALGLVERNDLYDLSSFHHNTRFAKLMNEINAYSRNFFAKGVHLKDLAQCIAKSPYKNMITCRLSAGNNTEIRQFVTRSILYDRPVLLAYEWGEGSGHCVLAIGIEIEDKKTTKIFVLDPGLDTPGKKRWNGEIMSLGQGGPRPFRYTTLNQQSISLFGALSVRLN